MSVAFNQAFLPKAAALITAAHNITVNIEVTVRIN